MAAAIDDAEYDLAVLEPLLRGFLEQSAGDADVSTVETDESEIEALRSLGYLD